MHCQQELPRLSVCPHGHMKHDLKLFLGVTVCICQYRVERFHKYASGHGSTHCSPGHTQQQIYLKKMIVQVLHNQGLTV